MAKSLGSCGVRFPTYQRTTDEKKRDMKLTKKVQGRNKVYRLRDEAIGIITHERVSVRDYVACTEDGEVWYADRALAEKDARDSRRRKVVFITEED
jgi:hypothetical protein